MSFFFIVTGSFVSSLCVCVCVCAISVSNMCMVGFTLIGNKNSKKRLSNDFITKKSSEIKST